MSDLTPLDLRQALPLPAAFRQWQPDSVRPEGSQATDPYAEGLAAGQELAAELFAQERDHWRTLLAAADALRPEPNEEVAQLIAVAVERLVTTIVGRFVPDAAWLTERIAAALALVDEADRSRRLFVHPADAALLDGLTLACTVVPDHGLARGALRLEDSSGAVDDGVALRLQRLRATLAPQ